MAHSALIRARHLLDAGVRYKWSRWAMPIGGNNIDTCAQRNISAHRYYGILSYPQATPFGFSGTNCYGTAPYRW